MRRPSTIDLLAATVVVDDLLVIKLRVAALLASDPSNPRSTVVPSSRSTFRSSTSGRASFGVDPATFSYLSVPIRSE